MLYLILGKMGSGKTLLMTFILLNIDITGSTIRHLFANYKIYHKTSVKIIKVYNLLNLPNHSEIFMDEGYTWLESRISSNHLNRYLSYILLQSRKRDTNFYITIQDLSTIDKRFRYQCDYLILCEKKGTEKNPIAFIYTVINRNNGNVYKKTFSIDQAKKLFYRYDTNQIIEPFNNKKLEYSLLKENPKLLVKRAEKIAKEIRISGKITHDKVKLAIMREGLDVNFEPIVYLILKSERE